MYIHLIADVDADYDNLCVGYTVTSEDGIQLYTSYNIDYCQDGIFNLSKGRLHLRTQLPQRTLNEGRYSINVNANFYLGRWMFDSGAGAPRISFEIRGGLSESPRYVSAREGILALVLPWQIVEAAPEAKYASAQLNGIASALSIEAAASGSRNAGV